MLNPQPSRSQARAPALRPSERRTSEWHVALEEPEQPPGEPLLRDPPPPPGYVDPIEESDVLQDPFASDDA